MELEGGGQGQGSTASSGLPCLSSQTSHSSWVWQNLPDQSPCQGQVAEPRAAGPRGGRLRHQELGGRADPYRLLSGCQPGCTGTATGPGRGLLAEPLHLESGTRPPVPSWHKGLPSVSLPPLDTTCQLSASLGQEIQELIRETEQEAGKRDKNDTQTLVPS